MLKTPLKIKIHEFDIINIYVQKYKCYEKISNNTKLDLSPFLCVCMLYVIDIS